MYIFFFIYIYIYIYINYNIIYYEFRWQWLVIAKREEDKWYKSSIYTVEGMIQLIK